MKKYNLREIIPPIINELKDPRVHPSETLCPSCSKNMTNGPIPCPDGKLGCLVIHYGLRCLNCGKFFYC